MKKKVRALFLFTALASIFSSCSKDDKIAHPIVGTWKLTSDAATGCDDPLDNYSETYPCTASQCLKVTFTQGGQFTFTEIDGGDVDTEKGTYSISGDEITLCGIGIPPDCDDPITFSISGSTLTFTEYDDFDGCTYTIVFKK